MSNPFDLKPKVPLSAIAALLGTSPKPEESPLLKALRELDAQSRGGLLGNALNPPSARTPERPYAGLFGRSPPARGFRLEPQSPWTLGSPVPQTSALASYVPPKPRNVFYSFHYDDVFRVNHVRKSGQFRTGDKVRDRSLWEKVRRTDEANLKRVINAGLNGTTVTCVLAGYGTWSREWVRYEIARSIFCNKGLLTVFIDGCKCPRAGYGGRGYNPLDFIALGWDNRIYEQISGEWYLYDKITTKVPIWPRWLTTPSQGRCMPLSNNAPSYDWIDDGGKNLIRWTNRAAVAAGK